MSDSNPASSTATQLLLLGSPSFCRRFAGHLGRSQRQQCAVTAWSDEEPPHEGHWDFIICQLRGDAPHQLGGFLQCRSQWPQGDVLVVVRPGEEDLGVGAMARGAVDFVLDDEGELEHIEQVLARSTARRRRRRPGLESTLERLRDAESFTSLAHPIMDLQTMRAEGWEFLSRGPMGPLAQPDQLFRWGKKHDRLVELDLLCLERNIASALECCRGGRIHFNLFSLTLADERVLPLLDQLAHGTLTTPCIELSESDVMTTEGDMTSLQAPLKERGIELALDDVGFQAHGLGYIKKWRPDVIKLDRRVTGNILRHSVKRDLVRSALALAEAGSAMLIVEGVENQSELEVLRGLGVRYAQGFYWGRPTTPGEGTTGLRLGGPNEEQT